MRWLSTVLEAVGVCLVAAAIGWVWRPGALLVLGLYLIAASVALGRRRESPPARRPRHP